MQICKLILVYPIVAAALLSCGGEQKSNQNLDANVDAGSKPDQAVALCPAVDAQVACRRASDCGSEDLQPSASCVDCPVRNPAMCQAGVCAVPDSVSCVSEGCTTYTAYRDALYQFSVEMGPQLGVIKSLWWAGVAAETAGGRKLSCADLMRGPLDLSSGCYNVVRMNQKEQGGGGAVHELLLSSLPAGEDLLFLVQAYGTEDRSGPPFGRSCVAFRTETFASVEESKTTISVGDDIMQPIE